MSSKLPLFLHESVVTLYPASSDGTLIVGAPVWSGALVNNFREALDYEEVKVQGAGARFSTAHHVDEETVLTLARSWILRKASSVADFKPTRNQQYVLQVLWNSDGYWYSRTYYGVTARSVTLDSQSTNQFLTNQVFRAQYSLDAGGRNATPVYTPITAPANESEPFGFFREDPFVVGEYLLGVYSFGQPVALSGVEFIGLAPQEDTVLTLEVNGVLRDDRTLLIPAGLANTAVQTSVDLAGYVVSPGNNIRWKITSGPDVVDAAWQGALVMQVANV